MSASSLASKVLQTSSNLQSNIRQMKASVEAIQNSWNGESYHSFRQSYNELEKKVIISNNAWESIVSQLNSLVGEVEAAEREKRARLAEARRKKK